MTRIYNADLESDRLELRNMSHLPTYRQVIPRDYDSKPYGSIAEIPPLEAEAPDVLIDEQDYEERLQEAHELQQLPLYHQYNSWAPKGFRYNQNGLGYCWTWSGTACMMDLRAIHGLETVPLAPVSMGYLVGWANRGNYLESFIRGAREQGICPAPDGNVNDLNRSSSFWRQHDDKRKNFRLDKVWDIDTRSGDRKSVQQALSCLVFGCPIYIAYNWWSHALELVSMTYDSSKLNNVIFGIRNSHNEDDIILMEGSKAVPDEMYAFVSLKIGLVG